MNASKELTDHINEVNQALKCAIIKYEESYDNFITFKLEPGYTPEQAIKFLENLNFAYDDGYGGQKLFGTLWWNDGKSWSERGEYDGAEWWEFKTMPDINKAFNES